MKKAFKVCVCVETFRKLLRFARLGGMPQLSISKLARKTITPKGMRLIKKRRTAKQRAATRKLVAFNKRRRR